MLVNSYLVFHVNLLKATQFKLGKNVTASLSEILICVAFKSQQLPALGATFPE